MQITLDWLKQQSACQDGYEWSIKTLNKKSMAVNNFIDKLMAENKFNWANWVIVRVIDRPQKIRYAVFAAEQVIDIFEKKYPNDKRPRNAIEAAKKVVENDTPKTRADADAAAYAADAAYADAAYAAAADAYAADADAAAYAYAAAAAAADAYAAAADAADAMRKEMQIKIINYGLSLLK